MQISYYNYRDLISFFCILYYVVVFTEGVWCAHGERLPSVTRSHSPSYKVNIAGGDEEQQHWSLFFCTVNI